MLEMMIMTLKYTKIDLHKAERNKVFYSFILFSL